jgi:hypothetical protein
MWLINRIAGSTTLGPLFTLFDSYRFRISLPALHLRFHVSKPGTTHPADLGRQRNSYNEHTHAGHQGGDNLRRLRYLQFAQDREKLVDDRRYAGQDSTEYWNVIVHHQIRPNDTKAGHDEKK